jgi:hypothetical protein
MKALVLLAGLLLVSTAHAGADEHGCYAYGRSYAEGEQDCDGRVCGKDGIWTGVVKSGLCDVTEGSDDDTGRDPASVGKKKKRGRPNARHPGKEKKK